MATFESAIFGNQGGSHQLLSSSISSSSPMLETLRFLVDRPAGHVGPEVSWFPYWGCQNIGDWWAVWCGEEDKAAPRKNMVAVKVALLHKDQWQTLDRLDELLTFVGDVPSVPDDARIHRLAGAILHSLAVGQGPVLIPDLSFAPLLLRAIWPRLWPSARASLNLRTLFGSESLDSVSRSSIVLIPSELRPRWHGHRFIGEETPDGSTARWFSGRSSSLMTRLIELNASRLPDELTVVERVDRIAARLEKVLAGVGTLADALVVVRTQEAFTDGFMLLDSDIEGLAKALRRLDGASVNDIRTASLVRLDTIPDREAIEAALGSWVVLHLPNQSPDDVFWILEQQAGVTHAPWWRRGIEQGLYSGCRSATEKWAKAIWSWWQARPESVPLVMRHLAQTDESQEWLASSTPSNISTHLLDQLTESCRAREWVILFARALGPSRSLVDCVPRLRENFSRQEEGLAILLLGRSPEEVVDAAAATCWTPLIAKAVTYTLASPPLLARAQGSIGLVPLLLSHLAEGGTFPTQLLHEEFVLLVFKQVLKGNADYLKIVGHLGRNAGRFILDYPDREQLLPLVGHNLIQGAVDAWWHCFLADGSIGKPPSALSDKVLASARCYIDRAPIKLVITLLRLFPEITETTFEGWLRDIGFLWERGDHQRLACLLIERRWKSAVKSMRWSWKQELVLVAWYAQELLTWFDRFWYAPDGVDDEPVPSSVPTPRKDMKVLFLAANPLTSSRLSLDEEARAIEEKIRDAKHRDAVVMRTRWAVRPNDLQQALLEDDPCVVHFSGHGGGAVGIAMHSSDQEKEHLVSAEALADLFRVLKGNIRVVVLNACYSESQAKAIVEEVDFVVGMSDSIGDDAARVFAAAFYRGLAFGRSVGTSFDLGVNELKLMGLSEDESIPKLLVRPGMDATATILVTPTH